MAGIWGPGRERGIYAAAPQGREALTIAMAAQAAAVAAQIVNYDGSLRICGAGGAAVLEEFPPLSDQSGEARLAEEK